jgi:sugar phosphate permease
MLEFNSGINQIEKTMKEKKKKEKEGPTHMSGQSSKISCVLVLKNPSMWLRLRV